MDNKRLTRFGSDWGGWVVDTTLLRDNSYVISAGLAHDITFDVGVMHYNHTLKVIGIDPTDVSKRTVENLPDHLKDRFTFINKALSANEEIVVIGGAANSILTPDGGLEYQAIPLNPLLQEYDVSVLKMDIECSEYEIIDALETLNVDQVCVEWHHWLPDQNKLTIQDTLDAIAKIKSLGYTEVLQTTNEEWRIIQESLFVRNDLV